MLDLQKKATELTVKEKLAHDLTIAYLTNQVKIASANSHQITTTMVHMYREFYQEFSATL